MKKYIKIAFITLTLMFSMAGCQDKKTADTNQNQISVQPDATNNRAEESTKTSESTDVNRNEETKRIVFQPNGDELIFDETPEKVLVLSSTTIELLNAIDVNISATSSLASKPEIAEKVKDAIDVGMATKPDMEIIATVKPDIIIAGSMFINMQEQFEAQGYKVWFVNNQTYEDTLLLIENFGYLFDKKEKANELIVDFEVRKQLVLDKFSDNDKTIMIIFGAGDKIMLGSEKCYSGSLLKMLGSKNVTDGMDLSIATSGYIPFSFETAVEADPDIILRIAHGNPEETKKMFDEMFEQNAAYNAMTAVENEKVYDLSYDLFFSNPGLKCIDALEYLAELINE